MPSYNCHCSSLPHQICLNLVSDHSRVDYFSCFGVSYLLSLPIVRLFPLLRSLSVYLVPIANFGVRPFLQLSPPPPHRPSPLVVTMNRPESEKPEVGNLTGEEIAKHNSRESCWVIVHGKAYDVTEFLPGTHLTHCQNWHCVNHFSRQSTPAAPRSSSSMRAKMPPKSSNPSTLPTL
jgi:hypothetical protein